MTTVENVTYPEIPLDAGQVQGWKDIPIREDDSLDPLIPFGPLSQEAEILMTSSIYFGEHSNSPYAENINKLEGSLLTLFARQSVVHRLLVAEQLLPAGHHLLVFDAYRPYQVQKSLHDFYKQKLREKYPDMDNETLESETQNYVSLPSMDPTRPSPHNTGGSVDVAIVKLDQAHEEELLQIRSHLADVNLDIAKRVGMEMRLSAIMRRHAKMLDFGTAFDHGGEKSALAYYESKIAAGEILADNDMRVCNNRRLLFGIMTQAGFQPYFAEWWHFNAPESNKSMISKYYSSSVQSKNYPLQLSQVSQPSLSLQTAYPNIQSSFSHPSQTSQRLTTLSQERRKISARDIIVSNQERSKGYYLYMFTLNDILQSNTNQVHIQSSATPNPALVFRSAHHDSRLITPGDLFIARKGTSSDDHSFIPAAARAGALAALCSTPATDVPPDFLQIIVPDVLTALHATARARTQRQKDTIRIGITGSNGKTSTKDAVAAVLSHKAPPLKPMHHITTSLAIPSRSSAWSHNTVTPCWRWALNGSAS